MRIQYTWDGRTGYVEASADEDVGWLRSRLHEETRLPASQGLRLKCGNRDVYDRDPISAINAEVQVILGGGLAGGASTSDAASDDEEAGLDPDARSGSSAQSKSQAMTPAERRRQREDDRAKRARETAHSSPAMLHQSRPAAGGTSKRPKANPRGRPSIDESNSGAGGSEGEAGGQGGSAGSIPSLAASDDSSAAVGDDEAGDQGGSSGGSPDLASPTASEAAEDEGEDGALLIGGFPPRPFQKSVIDIVEKPADPRAIQWVYSLLGKYGKSLLAEYLVGRYDALVIHEDAAKDSLKRIRDHRKTSDTFAQTPVLIIDIPRSKSTHTKTLYTTLERIQGVYGEWTTPPHILVFANDLPDVDKLSPDRMHVNLITSEYVLKPAKHLKTGLEAYDAHLAALQAQEEEAAETGVTPARLLPERGTAGSSGVTSSAPPDVMHQACGPAATRTCTALCPPNLAASHLEGHRAP